MAKRRRRHKRHNFISTLLLAIAMICLLLAGMMAYGMWFSPEDAQETVSYTPEPTATPELTPIPAPPKPTPTAMPMTTVAPLFTIAPTPEPERVNNPLPYVIVVNYKAQLVRVYTLDENGEYTVLVKNMLTSSGKTRICPEGVYKTHDYRRWHTFLDNTYGQYVIRIHNHFLFHSIPYSRYGHNDSLIAKYWSQLGDNVSGGCMRLMAKDAKWLYENCPKGTPVIVTKGEAVEQEVYDSIVQPPLVSGKWDPTDPDPENPDYFDESDATPPPTCYPYATAKPDQLKNTKWK